MAEADPLYAWISPDNDPAWHAALEEAALRNSSSRFLLLWISPPSLHVGKNQNLWAQVSPKEVFHDNIPVYRRLSGGGTVYHDPGNLNYSLISTGEPRIDFCKHLGTLLPFFEDRGISPEIRNRSDIFAGEKKFSGNAEYFSGGRILHHGTLLFDADLAAMQRYLTRSSDRYEDRAIDSNRSMTGNLKPLLKGLRNTMEFAEALLADICEREPESRILENLPASLTAEARRLKPRFNDPNWIFGRSPSYQFERHMGSVDCRIEVHKGRIHEAKTHWPGHESAAHAIDASLVGLIHRPNELFETVRALPVDAPLTRNDFWLDLFF